MTFRVRILGIAALLCSINAVSENWHQVTSPFCSQIKAKGAKVSGRPFFVFQASDENAKCCARLKEVFRGKTERFGYFTISKLQSGHYFVVFDLKSKRVELPVKVERVLDLKDCTPESKITVNKDSNAISWQEWITVD